MPPKPLSRTLLENTPLGELLRNENVIRLRSFLDERIPDGQDDYTFADAAAPPPRLSPGRRSAAQTGQVQLFIHLYKCCNYLS